MAGDDRCELCRRRSLTTCHFENERWWIVDCMFCGVPMAVFKFHVADPRSDIKAEARGLLQSLFHGAAGFYFDDNMRSIPDHYHVHMRLHSWGSFGVGEVSGGV